MHLLRWENVDNNKKIAEDNVISSSEKLQLSHEAERAARQQRSCNVVLRRLSYENWKRRPEMIRRPWNISCQACYIHLDAPSTKAQHPPLFSFLFKEPQLTSETRRPHTPGSAEDGADQGLSAPWWSSRSVFSEAFALTSQGKSLRAAAAATSGLPYGGW